MSRKNLFADIPATSSPSAAAPLARPLQGVSNGAMSAVKRSVNDLKERSRRADEIEKGLADGQIVIEIDPSLVDPSFVQDRMEGDIDGLRESIKEQGQQVPILVRLHPEKDGRYQVAFGHRRLRALKDLGLQAKAIVRELSDEQLVIAQGQENNEREDLSFIEKARFAARLKERFSRDVIMSSMSVAKSDLSTMLTLVEALPAEIIDTIGPAPGVGRRSWQELSELLEKTGDPQEALRAARSMQNLPSPERFKAVISILKPRKPDKGAPGVLSTSEGERLALVKNSKSKVELTIDKKTSPDFAAFVLDKLPDLFREFRLNDQRKTGE